MAYVLRTDFLKDAPLKRTNGKRTVPLLGVTVHNGATRGTARQLGIYGNYNSPEVSYHYSADESEVYHLIPEEYTAWHAGERKGNNETIAIEIGRDMDYDTDLYDRAEDNAAHLTAAILHRHGLGIDRVFRHYDWNRKLCPHRFFEAEAGKTKRRTTDEFKSLVKKYLDVMSGAGSGGGSKPVPQPDPQPIDGEVVYRVQIGAFREGAYATAMADRAKKAGYYVWRFLDTDGLIKIQIASYSDEAGAKAFAETVKAKGFNVFISKHRLTAMPAPEKPVKATAFAIGDKVKIKKGATDYNGGKLASFVYGRTHIVTGRSGDRIVVSYNGVIVAAVRAADLEGVQ